MIASELVFQISLLGVFTVLNAIAGWLLSKKAQGAEFEFGNPFRDGDRLLKVKTTEADPDTITHDYLDRWCKDRQIGCREKLAEEGDNALHLALNGWRATTDLRIAHAEEQIKTLVEMHRRIDDIYKLLAGRVE